MFYPLQGVIRVVFATNMMILFATQVTAEEFSRCPDAIAGLKSSIWKNLEIPVCWEDSANNFSKQRAWVQDSITQTWQKYSSLRFNGWNSCNLSSNGIRIGVGDINPHTKGIGNQLDGDREGMILNFSFTLWAPNCAKTLESCIRTIAVHEFGHALGFTHEQNRSDTPNWECREQQQGTTGDINITPWDLHSVMNYCNPKWAGDGKLSEYDIAGLQSWYGKPAEPENRFDG